MLLSLNHNAIRLPDQNTGEINWMLSVDPGAIHLMERNPTK